MPPQPVTLEETNDALAQLRQRFDAHVLQVEEKFDRLQKQFLDAQFIKRQVERHQLIIDGDSKYRVVGLMDRIDSLDGKVSNLSVEINKELRRATDEMRSGLRTEFERVDSKLAELERGATEAKRGEDARQNLMRGIAIGLGVNITLTGATAAMAIITRIIQAGGM
jgi:predicted  nucleic acid-binding Zn-ribbon protein